MKSKANVLNDKCGLQMTIHFEIIKKIISSNSKFKNNLIFLNINNKHMTFNVWCCIKLFTL